MADAPVRKLVVIEDSMVLSMAQNQQYINEFPFLQGLAAAAARKPRGCGGCGGANKERGVVLNAAKAAIAGMSPEKKKRMLKLLNAEKMRVIFMTGGKTMSQTISGG